MSSQIKEKNLVTVRAINRKMASQIQVVYTGAADKRVSEIAEMIYDRILNRKIAPLAWIFETTLRHGEGTGSPHSQKLWLIEDRDQVYFIEKPYPGHHDWHEGFRAFAQLPQLFIG